MRELISAKPTETRHGNLGNGVKRALPGEISTSRPAAEKWPLSMARKYGAEGLSNFQSSANWTLVAAWLPALAKVAAIPKAIALMFFMNHYLSLPGLEPMIAGLHAPQLRTNPSSSDSAYFFLRRCIIFAGWHKKASDLTQEIPAKIDSPSCPGPKGLTEGGPTFKMPDDCRC